MKRKLINKFKSKFKNSKSNLNLTSVKRSKRRKINKIKYRKVKPNKMRVLQRMN